MTCQKAGDLLSAYMDGEVAERQGEALKTHLDGCAGCREELETLKSAIALLEAPKAFARPEGLLEEFKAKYLPEAEAAAEAPRWGFRLPALPKMEWPSLGRVLMPMGGMAAAAAALLVALHGQSPQPSVGPADHAPAPMVATVPDTAAVNGASAPAGSRKTVISESPKSRDEGKLRRGLATSPASRPAERPRVAPPIVQPAPERLSGPRRHSPILAFVPQTERLTVRRPMGARLTAGNRYAWASAEPAVSKTQLNVVARHEPGTPTIEEQWADIAIVSRRKAAAATVEDGYAEVSCKNLATGRVKSMAVGIPAEPAPLASAAGQAGTDERTDGTGTETDR